MRLTSVVGARPQFIKAAPIQRALRERPEIEHTLIHTGQHYDPEMSDVFFEQLELDPPDHHLGVQPGTQGEMTGAMLEGIDKILGEGEPDWVLVYGDTNSTLAGALAAAKRPCRIAHVEAGLRSFNRVMPEEINRVVTDHLSHLCLAPTDLAIENLRREGIDGDRVVRTGDVMYDAVRMFAPRAPGLDVIAPDVGPLVSGPFVVATVHRAENTDDPARLTAIAHALEATAESIPVVFPVHPRTRAALDRHGIVFDRVHAIAPVGYLEMIGLERDAAVVVTDSGGVQKEAFFQRTPCVTVRTETEWVELVELGWNELADPTDWSHMAKAIHRAFDQRGDEAEPYGDGRSAEHIVSVILGS